MLHVHHADHADRLVAALAGVMQVPLADPFAAEVVAIPTRGSERWLAQRLSGQLGTRPDAGDGVCANVVFPTPRRLVEDAIASAASIDPTSYPWRPERAVWPLLELIEAMRGQAWLARLTDHFGHGADRRSRRLITARHLTRLFERYALDRPTMLRAWADGREEDGAGAPLAQEHRWQAELWRQLRDRIAVPDPAELLERGSEILRERPGMSDLPDRLALFGLTSVPARDLQLLHALAEHRDVHLLLLMPSPAIWQTFAAGDLRPICSRARARETVLPANPLLASWGRDSRELQLSLQPLAAAAVHTAADVAGDPAAATLLARLQADIRADRAPGPELPLLEPGDESVQVHVCHGLARQVEVLRDAILHALASDPSLEPRDVIVMCPDIETFAPLVEATFGAGEADVEETIPPAGAVRASALPAELRVRLADRSLRQTNPVLGVVTRLLELVQARVSVSELLDLIDRAPVRRRFRFEDDELTRIEDWIAATGIRWGLEAADRAPYKLDGVLTGTWAAGLDRLLSGVALAEQPGHMLRGVLPLDDVDSAAIDLAGRLAELLDRLSAALQDLRAPKPIADWTQAITTAADALTATSPRDNWQRTELQLLLADVLEEATTDGRTSTVPLAVTDVVALLSDRLAGRPTRANFRTGHLTICTLQPMRSIPHRVICLLGLDDAVFPRRAPRDGDDVLLQAPWIGDRDGRAEDRQILLDALMAAGDSLIVTYAGRDERTNAQRSPAVPVGELLDVIDRTAHAPDGSAGRDAVVVRHPLQPFAPVNFVPSALVAQRSWSFDPIALAAAAALTDQRTEPAPFLLKQLPPLEQEIIELDQLLAFVAHPVRAFLRQRLGIDLQDNATKLSDRLAIELDPLARWALGERLLTARRAGVDLQTAAEAEHARGILPPGELGFRPLVAVAGEVEAIHTVAMATVGSGGPLQTVDVRIPLPDGRTLAGTVTGVAQHLLPVVTYTRLDPRRRLESWVRLLALTAAFPERPLVATTVGRPVKERARRARATVARIAQPDGDLDSRHGWAQAELATLVDLYDRGMREPIPLFRRTSAAYANGTARQAEQAWRSRFSQPREDRESEHELVFGREFPFEDLLNTPPRSDEHGEGWDETESSRFGRYARRLWAGLLQHERLEDH